MLRDRGLSYGQIGKLWGISRQRVHQILSGYGNNLQAMKEHRWYGTMRLIVFERDGYKCTKCGADKNLLIHHIDGDDNRNYENNLVTLCRSCHVYIHKELTPPNKNCQYHTKSQLPVP